MARFALFRLVLAVPQLLGVAVAMFIVIHLAPGDPVAALVGDFPASPDYIRHVRADFGLDRPLGVQLMRYVGALARGDFGYSFFYRAPVAGVVARRAGPTALLTGTALAVATVLGLALGITSARRPFSWADNAVSAIALAGFSIPVFWLGQLLIVLFAVLLGWLPATGMASLRAPSAGPGHVWDVALHLLLPAGALSLGYLAITMRLTRAGMIDALTQDYIRTARGKGLAERLVLLRHALPNALLSILTLVGYNVGFILSGSVLVETVFGWPGLGRLLYDSLFKRDYPVLLGIFLTTAVVAIAANFLTDLAYAALDPRIRY